MRDLTSRLREIVRRDHGGAEHAATRELTYVPDTDGLALDPAVAAAALGGVSESTHNGCVVIDRVWDATRSHGSFAVGSYVPPREAPLGLFDPRAGATSGWADRVVFFDLETTGLSGGAGTLPFLAGCGWFEDGAFRVRQFFLAAPSGEKALLDALGRIFDEASLLVTFNGRTFDVPLMDMRWAFHRTEAPTADLPHFDMLPISRRLWGRRDARESLEAVSCNLSVLEQLVLGFHRHGDVPGFEIPVRYFHFLRTGDAHVIEGVLEHNRHDLLSLAGVMARALQLAHEGPAGARDAGEQMGLGRLYERAGDFERAVVAFDLASRAGDRHIRPHALARLATAFARLRRHDDAATAWQLLVDENRRRAGLANLVRRATEALAIHHEHRARDLVAAKSYALELQTTDDGRVQRDAAHRLGRIDRKLGGRGRLL